MTVKSFYKAFNVILKEEKKNFACYLHGKLLETIQQTKN